MKTSPVYVMRAVSAGCEFCRGARKMIEASYPLQRILGVVCLTCGALWENGKTLFAANEPGAQARIKSSKEALRLQEEHDAISRGARCGISTREVQARPPRAPMKHSTRPAK